MPKIHAIRLVSLLAISLVMLACRLPFMSKIKLTPVAQPNPAETQQKNATSAPAVPTALPVPPLPTEKPLERTALSETGPWLLIPANEGLWVANDDGSALTQITTAPVMSPEHAQKGIAPGGYFAFASADSYETLANLSLMLLKLPEGSLETITPLTPAGMKMPETPQVCEPEFEAMRALTMGDSLEWSPDGKTLAYIALTPGGTADLYTYSMQTGQITQLSDGSSQAFAPVWSPDGKYILQYGASCFGTGAGFTMTGAWASAADGSDTKKLYTFTVQETQYEYVVGWYPPATALMASSSGCQVSHLRTKNILNGKETTIYSGCASNAAIAPDGTIGILVSDFMGERPGFYLFTPQGQQIAYIPDNDGVDLEYSNGLGLFLTRFFRKGEPSYYETRSFDTKGTTGVYQSKEALGFPVLSQDGSHQIEITEKGIRLTGFRTAAGQIGKQGISQALLYETGQEPGILFFVNDTGEFYRARPPAYEPELLSAGITIWDGATWMLP